MQSRDRLLPKTSSRHGFPNSSPEQSHSKSAVIIAGLSGRYRSAQELRQLCEGWVGRATRVNMLNAEGSRARVHFSDESSANRAVSCMHGQYGLRVYQEVQPTPEVSLAVQERSTVDPTVIEAAAAAVDPKAAVAAAVTTLALGVNAQAALRCSEAELALWQSGVRRFREVVDVETDQVSQGCIDDPGPKRKRFAPALQQSPSSSVARLVKVKEELSNAHGELDRTREDLEESQDLSSPLVLTVDILQQKLDLLKRMALKNANDEDADHIRGICAAHVMQDLQPWAETLNAP